MLSCHSCRDELSKILTTERIIDICPGGVVLTVIIGKQQRVPSALNVKEYIVLYPVLGKRRLQSVLSGLLGGDRQNGLKKKSNRLSPSLYLGSNTIQSLEGIEAPSSNEPS